MTNTRVLRKQALRPVPNTPVSGAATTYGGLDTIVLTGDRLAAHPDTVVFSPGKVPLDLSTVVFGPTVL